MKRVRAAAAGLVILNLSAGLGACARYDYTGSIGVPPAVGTLTRTGRALADLPPAPAAPLNVAVYDFQDLTGQNKSSFLVGFPEFSRAVTQGASAILVDALKTAGNGGWFNVVERGYLDSLLRERKLIQDTYAFLKRDPKDLIDPLKFAEYIVTGGVVSYDSPTQSAGASALFAGYGGGFNHSKDLLTINLRLVRVRDGVVITSINASRPVVTTRGNASATRVIDRRVLDASVSASVQEAVQTAVREAIEAGVYELVRQGNTSGIWLRKVVPSPKMAVSRKATTQNARTPTTTEPNASSSASGGAKDASTTDQTQTTNSIGRPSESSPMDGAAPDPARSAKPDVLVQGKNEQPISPGTDIEKSSTAALGGTVSEAKPPVMDIGKHATVSKGHGGPVPDWIIVDSRRPQLTQLASIE